MIAPREGGAIAAALPRHFVCTQCVCAPVWVSQVEIKQSSRRTDTAQKQVARTVALLKRSIDDPSPAARFGR